MPKDRFVAFLQEMELDPLGYGRMDLEAVLLRVEFGRHRYEGFDLYLHDGYPPVHLRTSQSDVPDFVVRRVARDALSILKGGVI